MSPPLAVSGHFAFGDESMFLYNIMVAPDKREKVKVNHIYQQISNKLK